MAIRGAATNGPDRRVGDAEDNVIRGLAGDDTLLGKGGGDDLLGDGGDDTLEGGRGADRLTGGDGSDTYLYLDARDNGVGVAKRDTITNFDVHNNLDPDDDFVDLPWDITFVSGAFSGAFQARVEKRSGADGLPPTEQGALVQINLDGDAAPEVEILFRAAQMPDPQASWFI